MVPRRRWLCVLVPLCLAGCREDEPIVKQTVPRVSVMQRFFGAILPKGEKIWFFKLVGTEDDMAELQEPFDEFLKSIDFTDPLKPKWKLPKGWIEEVGKEMRYKTIHIGPKEKKLDLSVTALGLEAEDVTENVNRWRAQIGLVAFHKRDLEPFLRKVDLPAGPAIVVDMIGPGAVAQGKGPPMGAPPRPGPDALPFKYEAPKGWEKIANITLSVLTFQVKEGDKKARVTVSELGKKSGSLLDNVNRWRRDYAGLPEINETQLAKDVQELAVGLESFKYVDIDGPKQRILGVVWPRPDSTYFFKMAGHTDAVEKHKKNFETFVKSVQFGG
ncbi:MAG: hypothetical protein L0215_01420 [Gemmataceae bacterium]|nr:hypothetical protein [Gemmataceae bacterium]